jgi:hypothetical protein
MRGTLLAMTLAVAGLFAILDVGGTAAEVFGLLAVALALVSFDRAVFRIAAGSLERDEHPHRPSVR